MKILYYDIKVSAYLARMPKNKKLALYQALKKQIKRNSAKAWKISRVLLVFVSKILKLCANFTNCFFFLLNFKTEILKGE